MKILIFGSSGFLGTSLTNFLETLGHTVIPFSRTPSSPYFWDPKKRILPLASLEGCDVIINLSGENIFGRWTRKKKESIVQSRLGSTQFLVETISQLKKPPQIYIGASAIGYYGDRPHEILHEKSPPGHGFLANLCIAWENISAPLKEQGVRVIHARFGTILDKKGGALAKMLPLFKAGLGGKMGSGKQIMSWIALEDVLAAIDFTIKTPSLEGPINFTSPHPLSNLEITSHLKQAVHLPALFHIPSFLLFLIFSSGAEIFLQSSYVLPLALLDAGYKFTFSTFQEKIAKDLQNFDR